jgi:hypothetical protein
MKNEAGWAGAGLRFLNEDLDKLVYLLNEEKGFISI